LAYTKKKKKKTAAVASSLFFNTLLPARAIASSTCPTAGILKTARQRTFRETKMEVRQKKEIINSKK